MLKIIRQWIQDTLGFSKTEANGTLVLAILVLAVFILPKLYWKYFYEPKSFTTDPKLKAWAEEIEKAFEAPSPQTEDQLPIVSPLDFDFDPNTATPEELTSLGFTDRVVRNMQSYLEKGGRFRIKSDLKKIYDINQQRVDNLWPHILLPEKLPEEKSFSKKEELPKPKATEPKKLISINQATAEELQTIRGIGPARSERIVKFRNLLGGFHSAKQLKEIYGLDSVVLKTLTESVYIDTIVQKLNINQDSAHVLSSHPYISYATGRAIFNYRLQHGPYESIIDIKSIKIIDDSLYQKIYPYLSLNP